VIITRPTCKNLQQQIQPLNNVHLHRHRRVNWGRRRHTRCLLYVVAKRWAADAAMKHSQRERAASYKDNASQWKSELFLPHSRSLKNPWKDRHLHLHGWLYRETLPLCKIPSRYDTLFWTSPKYAKMRIKWLGWYFWYFCQPTAKIPATIFTISTSNDVFSRKGVPFGGLKNKILYFDPISPPKRKFLANFRRDLEYLTQLNFGSK